MKYLNKVQLIGNVTAEPEQRAVGEHTMVTFTVATNRSWKDSAGEKKTLAEYHSVVVWGGLADHCMTIVQSRKLLYVEGYLKTRTHEQDGIRKTHTEIVGETIIVLDAKEDRLEV